MSVVSGKRNPLKLWLKGRVSSEVIDVTVAASSLWVKVYADWQKRSPVEKKMLLYAV